MQKNAIVILANNLDLLKAQIDNLPKLDCDYIICNETRIGNKLPEIKAMAPKGTKFLDSKKIVKEFAKLQDTPFLHEYTMGMNILLQWYVFKFMKYDKVVFTEEDVILNENINKIFDEEKCLYYTWNISAQTKPYDELVGLNKKYVDELDKMFNIHFNSENYLDIWHNAHLASGQRYYVRGKFNLDKYEKKLLQFYRSEVMRECWSSRRTHRSFYMDERFEGFFAYYTKILNHGMKPYTCIEIAKPEKKDISKYNAIQRCGGIWHNATVSNKLKWIEELRKNGKIV